MSKNTARNFLAASIVALAMFALAPSSALAFHGNLVVCTPSAGIAIPVPLSPGLTCTDATSKITLVASAATGNALNNCVGNGAAPWDTWAAGGVGSKIPAASVPTISTLSLKVKAKTFGICNFSGDANSLGANGAGKFQFFSDAAQTLKVKGAGGSVFGRIGAAGAAAAITGLVTKGFGVGQRFQAVSAIDLGDPNNGCVISCNDPFDVCPTSPCTTINVKADGSGKIRIDVPSNDDCTGAGAPMTCCTGAGTGTC